MASKLNISTNNDIAAEVEIDTTMLPDIIPLSNDLIRKFSQANDSIQFINLWASWCTPCIEEMPAIGALRKKYPSVKFMIISADMEEEERMYKSSRILYKNGIDFPTYIIKGQNKLDLMSKNKTAAFMAEISNGFKNDPGYPYTIVQRNGKIIYEGVGIKNNAFETYLFYDSIFSSLMLKKLTTSANYLKNETL